MDGIALADLARLYEFLSPVNPSAAARTVQGLTAAPSVLLNNPRIGQRLHQFDPREVRRILVQTSRNPANSHESEAREGRMNGGVLMPSRKIITSEPL